MRYLVTSKTDKFIPFLTHWFDAENNFNPEMDMVVYDLSNKTYTQNGIDWLLIEIDHL